MNPSDIAIATYVAGVLWCCCATVLGRWDDTRPTTLLAIGGLLCFVA